MEISQRGIDFIKSWEGFRQKAYLDSASIWTIGYGTIRYEDGSKVQQGDTITQEEATKLFALQLKSYVKAVNDSVTKPINQDQFDALVSFTYNLGRAALRKSTLLKKVNIDPTDPAISTEFRRWVKAGGKFVQGLLNRRIAESSGYFSQRNQ